jgi:hypothetical protein
VVELRGRVIFGGEQRPWPVAVVAEMAGADDDSVVFRSYFSRQPTEGRRFPRTAFLPGAAEKPGGVIGQHVDALAAGDVDAVLATFEAPGYLRETTGQTHRGGAALRAYLDGVSSVELQPCVVTDDGVRCVVEYNCRRWAGRELTPRAGLAVYERGPDGRLAAVRLYDDLPA